MTQVDTRGIKVSDFKTQATLQPIKGTASTPIQKVKVDDKAATRQAIIVALRRKGFDFQTRSDWKARESAAAVDRDWGYKAVAIHHAGNSFSCSADGADELRKAEAVDMKTFGQLSYHYAIDCQGAIYEALDIRYKGAHIEGGNTGVIGIVFLADFSVRGEAGKYSPGAWNVMKKRGLFAGIKEWIGVQNDKAAVVHDEPTERQLAAAEALIGILCRYFNIARLGGHREFAQTHGTSRACPGVYGMIVAEQLRRKYGLAAP